MTYLSKIELALCYLKFHRQLLRKMNKPSMSEYIRGLETAIRVLQTVDDGEDQLQREAVDHMVCYDEMAQTLRLKPFSKDL